MNYILTNGCFDLFHVGHADFLDRLKKLALTMEAQIVVFLNSDQSVAKLKGPSRPINSWEDRRYMLSHWADEVIHVGGETCEKDMEEFFMRTLPGEVVIYAKDCGYGTEASWAHSQGLPVVVIHRSKMVSTTRIIEKIYARESAPIGQGRYPDTGYLQASASIRDSYLARSSSGIEVASPTGLRIRSSDEPIIDSEGRAYGSSIPGAEQAYAGAAMGGGSRVGQNLPLSTPARPEVSVQKANGRDVDDSPF